VHLTLFDFSLSRTPTDNLGAGTRPYLEPFLRLRKPPRWDEYAERFAAAMTLYEMATGTLPRWGDGKTDPALQKGEVLLDAELFDAALREPLSDFFRRALLRDVKARYGSAEEMRAAWRQIFARVDEPAVPGLSVSSSDGEGSAPFSLSAEDLNRAERDTPLVALGISTRATNALSRANVLTVEQLLALPVVRVSHMRGVGNKTRKEIMQVLTQLGERFAGSALSSSLTGTSEDGGGLSSAIAGEVQSIDLLADKLTSRRTHPKRKPKRCAVFWDCPIPDAQAGWPHCPPPGFTGPVRPMSRPSFPSPAPESARLLAKRASAGTRSRRCGRYRTRFPTCCGRAEA
jgi:serine/threonine protein kinase